MAIFFCAPSSTQPHSGQYQHRPHGYIPPYIKDLHNRLVHAPLEERASFRGLKERKIAVRYGALDAIIPSPIAKKANEIVVTYTAAAIPSSSDDSQQLPGNLISGYGTVYQQAIYDKDRSVKEAHLITKDFYLFLNTVFNRDSLDNGGMPLVSTVHYKEKGRPMNNAFAEPNTRQMVYGDGDGKYFTSFTRDPEVIAHELFHLITELTANLDYENQPGSLNEHMSDVGGTIFNHWRQNKTVLEEESSPNGWDIGDMIMIGPRTALRSMKAPGTAYNIAGYGKDPQGDHMGAYQDLPLDEDEGGVHINSGIPNRAFYLLCMELANLHIGPLGDVSWGIAGQIWYNTLLSEKLKHNSNFKQFANVTLSVADTLYKDLPKIKEAVLTAWRTVGVLD